MSRPQPSPFVAALLCALACSSNAAAATAGPPSVVIEDRAVIASNLTAGGSAVLFAVARESNGYSAALRRWEAILHDDDGDAVVRLELDREVPWKSIWIAVDLSSGELGVATPDGFPLREQVFPAGAIRAGAGGRLVHLVDRRGYGELLLVRPGENAWRLSLANGGAEDADGVNDDSLTARLDRLRAIDGAAPPPEELAAGDVVVMIDPHQLDYYAARLVR